MTAENTPMTDDEFFGATEQLATIHRWARARYAAPWAVLFGVLLRVAASTGPHVQLPGIIGGRASLNLLCAFVAPSGGGKGISDKVSREAWPAQIPELPIGTGEGLAETYVDRRGKETADDDPIVNAIFNCPEIDVLTGIDARQGSTVLGTLKAFAMGEQIGATNASKSTTRIVQAHSYRGCLSVSAQPGHTGVILADSTGGTPQRFLWVLTIDPDMPDGQILDPEPLDHRLPALLRPREEPGRPIEIVYGLPEIRETIVAAHLDRQRGKGDALNGHWMLTRCKVAATIAILHHRTVVSELDWALSEAVMAVSDRTRRWVVDQAKQAARAKMRERALFRAYGEETIDARQADVVRRRILRILSEGPATHGIVHSRIGKREYKELFSSVIASLLDEGEISVEHTQRGKRYSIFTGVKVDPGVNVDNRRSEWVDPRVNVDPDSNEPQQDNRRSPTNDGTKLSTREWFDNHIETLRSEGHTTAESLAVYKEGEAEGHDRKGLRVAASRNPGVQVIARRKFSTTWDISGGRTA
ncbi:MAG: hypothetical protein ACSLE7_12080 [Mycobacterium sp.]